MKEKGEKKKTSLDSKHYNVLCDLILSHSPEDLEKGNALIVRVLIFVPSVAAIVNFSYSHPYHTFQSVSACSSLLFLLCVSKLQICTAFHLNCLILAWSKLLQPLKISVFPKTLAALLWVFCLLNGCMNVRQCIWSSTVVFHSWAVPGSSRWGWLRRFIN